MGFLLSKYFVVASHAYAASNPRQILPICVRLPLAIEETDL